ncbi:hypothetical protein [Pseudomonas sp. CFBP 8772]|nr:hypothetical protein [Pseudomonas sp. CFBP 8772]
MKEMQEKGLIYLQEKGLIYLQEKGLARKGTDLFTALHRKLICP